MLNATVTTVQRSILNILIVDDDVNHGRSVRDLLAVHDLPADVVSSGQQGLQMLRDAHQSASPYEALVLDLHIPDLSGIDILRAIGEQDISVKTIVLSGEQELSSVAPILKLGAYDYLRKPFQAQQLVTSVGNALDSYHLETEVAAMHVEAEENARLYEFLLNASPDLVYMLNANGEFQFINHQLDGIFDADFQSLGGHNWRALFKGHEPLAEKLQRQFDERRTGVRATVAEQFSYTSDIGTPPHAGTVRHWLVRRAQRRRGWSVHRHVWHSPRRHRVATHPPSVTAEPSKNSTACLWTALMRYLLRASTMARS